MALEFPNITLGTAGHIDHGKTALVKFLTGCDTDRLKEEKERGMTIDLGYAPCTIGELQVGIVDVPGHEGFIRTMVAGASGIDGVIFVVAADDGVMPQTREHMDILTLLGVRHGIVALTKVDRVDDDGRELARATVEAFLRGTFLEGAPILPVNNLTGDGFDPFYNALVELVKQIKPKRTDGVFRLPIDRAFSVKGRGTVVAGIPISGAAKMDEEVEILPQGWRGGIKGIQVYNRATDRVLAGQCAALNIRQWDYQAIERGHVVATPGFFTPSAWYVCRLSLLPHASVELKNGARARLHTGTAESVAAVYNLEERDLRAGDDAVIQVRLSEPLAAGPGDRFILRGLTPVQTIGGGVIIEATPYRLRRQRVDLADLRARAAAVLEPAAFVEYAVRAAPDGAIREEALAQRTKLPLPLVRQLLGSLAEAGTVLRLAPNLVMHRETLAMLTQRLLSCLAAYHAQAPESPGMGMAEAQEKLGLSSAVFEALVACLVQEHYVVAPHERLALPGHQAVLPDKDQALLERIMARFHAPLFQPPERDTLAAELGAAAGDVERLLRVLFERAELVDVGDGMLFHRDAVDRARQLVEEHIQREGRLESVKFKYLLETTRKFALPLLDYLDRIGVTQRVGNTRFLPARRAPK